MNTQQSQTRQHHGHDNHTDLPVFRAFSTGSVSVAPLRHGPLTRLSVSHSRFTVHRPAPDRLTIRTRQLTSTYHLDDAPDADELARLIVEEER